uniref:Mitochondrial fission regulator 2 n=1 Tax=Graphocephala atropunctata TaxID=36148 RepID=A0A1B6KJ23_9HEMI
MSSEIAILSFGVFFIEDTFSIAIRHSAEFKRMLTGYLTRKKGFRIVRKIGSNLKWIRTHRLHIVLKEDSGDSVFNYDGGNVLESHCQCSQNSVEDPKNSVPLESKFEELEKELCDLRTKVAMLLLVQENKALDIDSERENRSHTMSSEDLVMSSTNMPPPPPLPPPLPPSPFVHKTVLVKVKPKTTNPMIKNTPIGSLLEELSKRPPKLRHVELSPGGRPVRQPSIPADPSDILTAVLKKRFEAIHSPQFQHRLISPPDSPLSPMVFGQ